MNFSKTYRRMNEPVGPSPDLIRKTLSHPDRHRLPLRRLAADITQIRLVKGEHRRKAGRQPDSIAKLRAVCLHDWLRQRHGNHPLGTAGRQEQQRKNGYVD